MKRVTLEITGPADIEINWGDGGELTTSTALLGESRTLNHDYPDTGIYDISVTGWADTIVMSSEGLTEIKSFGGFEPSHFVFPGCSNLVAVPATLPSSVTSLAESFTGCPALNDPNISNWNTVNVTNYASTFEGASAFNQPLFWNTSNGTDFSRFLMDATAFNSGIDLLDFTNATTLQHFLEGAGLFNQPVTVSAPQCINVSRFFYGATSMNSALSFTDMAVAVDWSNFLRNCSAFNQPIEGLDTGACTDFSSFLEGASSFNRPLAALNVSSGVMYEYMLADCVALDTDISTWDVADILVAPEGFADGSGMSPGNLPQWGVELNP